jgi:transposase
MFIRQTRTNYIATGENYFTYRLVRGERVAGKVRQVTLLNLGRHFPIKQQHWPLLCSRIEQLLHPQADCAPVRCTAHLERAAQRYVGQLIARAPLAAAADTPAVDASSASADAQSAVQVEIDSLVLTQPRAVGVEHVALHAVTELGLVEKLSALGVNGVMRACILGNLIGRMAQPASELATWNWLQTQSALGELLEVDFNSLSHMRLYRASDLLMHHREAIEHHVFGALRTLFSLEETVTLYDLTNTYFEGQAAGNAKAKQGRSKEKRSDCPLLTLGLVLDGSGFVRRSRTFSGNVGENTTLEEMLTGLQAPAAALVIMDAGIATQANLDWLVAHGYRYLVVRRGGARQFDDAKAVSIETAGGAKLRLHKQFSADGQEVQLYCHSEGRQAKETAMVGRFTKGFEQGLQKIAAGLTKPRGEKRHAQLLERIGRLKQKSHGASQHYQLTLSTDETGKTVTGLTWEKHLVAGTMATHPGVYCLRSNELAWDEAKLWGTYMMLTDLESVFRSLKSELGLRPVFHSKEDRSDGHLFITVLAYQCVQLLRTKLKAAGINESWASLRQTLCVQRRVTASLRRSDGGMVHLRKSTVAEPALMAIYDALGVNALPGGTRKLIC